MKPPLDRYAELVRGHPRGLVSRGDREHIPLHIEDSLAGLPVLRSLHPSGPINAVDVGSGGGFPAIPLLLQEERLRYTLIESVGWKADFLTSLKETLDLNERLVVSGVRAELAPRELGRERYSLGTARAVAAPTIVAEYLSPLITVGGSIVLWTTTHAMAEVDIDSHTRLATDLGLDNLQVIAGESPLRTSAVLACWQKNRPALERYPRRDGVARRSPL